MIVYHGRGVINTMIDKLPVELHIPGYQYCGPGTKLQKRILQGDQGINPLDEACKEHDIAYGASHKLQDRHKADKVLENKAWERIKAKNATKGEKVAAFGVATIMKTKRKFGLGLGVKNRKAGRISFHV